jgi:hypothetical protein
MKQQGSGAEAKGDETYGFFPFGIPFFPWPQSPPTGITRDRIPATPPVEMNNARAVLAGKGSLRRAKKRRALAGCAPLRRSGHYDGRLRREHDPA